MSRLMNCPVTGRDVFPEIAERSASGPRLLDCPGCGQKHLWLPLENELINLSGIQLIPDHEDVSVGPDIVLSAA